MSTEHFQVLNVKCAGCAANIQNGIGQLNGVDKVDVNIESGDVNIEGAALDRSQLAEKLAELGYPEA